MIPDAADGFHSHVRDVPEAITEAILGRKRSCGPEGVLEAALAMYIVVKEPLPVPPEPKADERMVPLLARGMAKTALYDAMCEQGVGGAELTRRLRWHLPQVSRLLDLRLIVDVARAA